MGAVYSAYHLGINRHIAIKILQPNVALGNERIVALFEREAKMSGRLVHENIASVFDAGRTAEGLAYIAMEWLEGRTLEAELSETGPLSFTRVTEILRPVAAALSAAHAAHIIHRDLKPSNVMLVQRPDGSEQIKVLDFGIAKVISDTVASPVSALMGTPDYASPEQFRMGARIDGRADIYSLGVMLFQMLTGALPFESTSIHEMIQRQLQEPPPPLRGLRPDAPQALADLINLMLAKDPAERPQQVSAIPELFARAISLPEHERLLPPTLIEGQPQQADGTGQKATVVERLFPDTLPAQPQKKTSAAVFRSRAFLAAILSGIALLLASGAYYFLADRNPVIDSIAVLPFLNEAADTDMEYLSDGLSEGLISSLAKLPQMRVIARSSVMRYRTENPDPQVIGQDLHVRAVLVGRVRQQGESLTISAELVDTRDNRRLWGESYNRRATDLLIVQQELTKEIAVKLRSHLNGADQERVAKRPTENTEAFQLYLKGRYAWNKRSAESLRQAETYFRQAIDKDPLYALAYSGLADTYLLLGPVATGTLPTKEAMPRQRAAALEAIKIDDTLAEAHTSLAVVRMTYDWNWQEAELEFKRAIELNPNYALAHQWYGSLLSKTGHVAESLTEYQRAQELDPFSRAIPLQKGLVYYYARRPDEALAHFRKLLESMPQLADLHSSLAIVYEQKQEYETAIAEINQAIALSERSPDLLGALGRFLRLAGRKEEAAKVEQELMEATKGNNDWLVDLALFHAGTGNRDQAISLLEKAVAEHSPLLRDLQVHPLYDSLRTDPRFVTLLRRVGLEQ